MSLTIEQFRERVVDYLYGELDGEALREFEACLVESAACRSELAALQSTLRTARAGLTPVDREVPPARVRTAVLAAAAEAQRARSPAALPVRALNEHLAAWWSWLRTPWLVPTIGVAAAVAVVVLGREIEPLRRHQHEAEHETVAHEAPTPTGSAATSAPTDVPENSRGGAPSRDEPTSLAQEGEAKSAISPRKPAASAAARGRVPSKGFAQPPAGWADERAAQPESPRQAASQPAAKKSAAPEVSRASRAVEFGSAEEQESAPPAARDQDRDDVPGRGASSADKVAAGGALGGGASAGAPRTAAAPVVAQRAPEKRESADGMKRGAASAPAPPPAAPARIASESADQAPHGSAGAPEPSRGVDALVLRAQEHVAARRFREAASDYRALIRSYPQDARVAAWKKSLAFAALAARQDGGAR